MHARRLTTAAAAVAVALALSTTACTSGSNDPNGTSADSGIALFGSDGVMTNGLGPLVKVPGGLSGMSGTAPLVQYPRTYMTELKKIDPTVNDTLYSGQAYDAVMLAALATEIGRSTDPKTIASYIDGVTTLSKGGAVCTTWADCLNIIEQGRDIEYRGYTIASGFVPSGEPSTGTYGTEHFGPDNLIEEQKTEFVTAGDPAKATTTNPPAPASVHTAYNGPALTIGLLLPVSGALSDAGRPIIAGAKLAVQDINKHGGVLGKPLKTEFQDDGTSTTKSVAGEHRLIDDGCSVIVGPSFSDAVAAAIPVAVASDVVLISPSATSAALSTVDDHGMFFRTATNDDLQSQALADVVARSGAQRVMIVARNDSYGTGLEKGLQQALVAGGMPAADVTTAEYDATPNADNSTKFAQIAAEVSAFHADSVVIIGYDEVAGFIAALSAAHLKLRATS